MDDQEDNNKEPLKKQESSCWKVWLFLLVEVVVGFILTIFMPVDIYSAFVLLLIGIAIIVVCFYPKLVREISLGDEIPERQKTAVLFALVFSRKILITTALLAPAICLFSKIYPIDFSASLVLTAIACSIIVVLGTPDLIKMLRSLEDFPEQGRQLAIYGLMGSRNFWFLVGFLTPIGYIIQSLYSLDSPICIAFNCFAALILLLVLFPAMAILYAYFLCQVANYFGKYSKFVYAIAMKLVDLAPEIDDLVPLILAFKGGLYLGMKKFEDAEHFCTLSIKQNSFISENYYNRGCARYYLRKLDLAEQDFSSLISLEPDKSTGFSCRSMARKSGSGKANLYRALEDANRAIECSPNDYYAYFLRASVYRLMYRYDEALDDIRHCLRLKSKYHYASCIEVKILMAQNKTDEAEALISKVFKRHGADEWTLSVRSDVFMEKNNFHAALQDANDTIKVLEDKGLYAWSLGYTQRAEALIYLNRGREASTDVERAIELEPNGSFDYILRARINRLTNRYEEALLDLDTAVQQYPFVDVWGLRSSCLRKMGKYVEAVMEAEKGKAARPQNSYVHAMHALALLELDRIGEAIESAKKATELNRYNAEAWMTLGRVSEMSGDIAAGQKHLSNAIKLNPYLADAYEYRASVYEKLDEQEKAEEDRKKCQKLRDDFMA